MWPCLQSLLTSSLLMWGVSFLQCGWYWGPMNWEDAEMKLKGKPDGSFLVRDSSDPRYILSLSFRSQGITHHTRMEHYRGEGCGRLWDAVSSRSQSSALPFAPAALLASLEQRWWLQPRALPAAMASCCSLESCRAERSADPMEMRNGGWGLREW